MSSTHVRENDQIGWPKPAIMLDKVTYTCPCKGVLENCSKTASVYARVRQMCVCWLLVVGYGVLCFGSRSMFAGGALFFVVCNLWPTNAALPLLLCRRYPAALVGGAPFCFVRWGPFRRWDLFGDLFGRRSLSTFCRSLPTFCRSLSTFCRSLPMGSAAPKKGAHKQG